MNVIDEWLQTDNAKLFVIMEDRKSAMVSIERDINTIEPVDNIYSFLNDILNEISETIRKCYIKIDNAIYHIALAKVLNLKKGDTFYIIKT